MIEQMFLPGPESGFLLYLERGPGTPPVFHLAKVSAQA
jgi:hypothetical protein